MLINSCLSNVPLYIMKMYWLPAMHQKIDSNRKRFYWEDISKFHMVKWVKLCKPADDGAVDIVDPRVRNLCLLNKWLIRLLNDQDYMTSTLLPRNI